MNILNQDIQYIKGIGEKRARLFNKLGIFTLDDLLYYFPRRYEDWSNTTTVDMSQSGDSVSIKAVLISTVKEHMVRRGMVLYKCDFSDGEKVIHVTLFNNKYLAKSLKQYDEYILFGKIEKTLTYASMSSPKIEKVDKGQRIHPIYSLTGSLTSRTVASVVKNVLDNLEPIEETLSKEVTDKYNLMPLDTAIREIHFPTSNENMIKARERLIFEELLVLSVGMIKLKGRSKKKSYAKIEKDYSGDFAKGLPFELTNAQKRCIGECVKDMQSDYPMNRLLQGDVGSGKTAVAASIIYTAVNSHFQCALMAPTEILATQHFESFNKFFNKNDISIRLLTGSVKAAEKKQIKEDLINGKIDLLIGTHAIIQNDVEFKNLGLIITDEQHRFGVNQRANLAMKGNGVNTLVMSATPIPRTLALMIYGDLDLSVLDELPPGRQEIRTDVVDSSYHKRMMKFLRSAVDRGEQGYIICPLVEEGESESKAAVKYAEELSKTDLFGINLGLLHGKMKPTQKDNVMKGFASGDIKVLVATTVVEVGVDVPNATIMIIENAERFGLSQLHQLRGRIGRGDKKSYCILVSDNKSDTSKARLMIMKHSSNGFEIADEDLKLRGPGDFFGERQHGLPALKIADMVENMETLKECRQCADMILQDDSNLDKKENRPLLMEINKMFEKSNMN